MSSHGFSPITKAKFIMMEEVKIAAGKKLLFLPHAIKQMSRPDRMISADEIREATNRGEIIEEYPDDARGPSCLVLYTGLGRILHVVCSPKPAYLAIITAYVPDPDLWTSDFKVRK